jgi:hypothetical protein
MAIASPAPTPKPEPAPVADLSTNLAQSGLVMIETAASSVAQATSVEAPQQALGRKPKAAVVVAAEPLQMVETRHD